MAYGPKRCGCCGELNGVEAHHLYSTRDGCPDDLTVWLCHDCHRRAHELKRRVNVSERTRVALAAKKAQGAKLGNPTNLAAAGVKGRRVGRDAADRFARNVRPVIEQIRASGAASLRAIAAELNARGVATARGGVWEAQTVRNLLLRTEAA